MLRASSRASIHSHPPHARVCWSHIRYRRYSLPRKCHIPAMENHTDDAAGGTWLGGAIDHGSAHGTGDGRATTRDDAYRGSSSIKVEAMVDTWIDDHQWLARFPGDWGGR